ncbi:electron transport complex subunit RsxC [uncultured Oceanicoccus sp.]|uniref:electron transport complex subunit RsxC n=1 Tax=uncultured Oceanicoccus sp. TaxID=1706381 RepID=UPI0030DD12DD
MNTSIARKVWDFHGGVHPPENKTQSNRLAITSAGIPGQLVFPLSQHIGAPATPIVTVGQRVLKGEMIAEAKGFVSVPVHASTSGEVIAIEHRSIAHPSGMTAPCIIIQADGNDQWIEHSGIKDYTSVDKSELLNRIRQAGIAGMGGAGFPAAVKLGTGDDQVIETLIINGTECEPYITADDMLMRERADDIIAGANILKHLIQPTQETIIGVEDNKPEGIAALQQAAEGSGIEIVSFPTKYPSGGEKQLIQILTGKEVPSGGLPAEVGIVCQNLGTTVAIYRAIQWGEPLISRITTVTGDACEQNRNYEVLLGTPISHLLELAGYQQKNSSRLIMGGPMMGFTLDSETVPVVKTTNCILAPSQKEMPPPTPAQACIRCGLCAEACPVSLLPQQMYWFARGKEYEKLEAHNLMDCIECGACSFACPSNIPLVQYYRASKADIRQQKDDAIKAEQSKARFEARLQRIERQEAEKEAKRKARKAAAEARAAGNAQAGKVDAVQAAVERAKAKKAAADPAQAAIEKAMAKRAGSAPSAPTQASLEAALASIEKRLVTAKEKLQQATQQGSDKIEALRIGVEKTEAKYQTAKTALDEFIANNPALNNSADPAQLAIQRAEQKTPRAMASGDAAQDAIARALAKREAASSMSDEERLLNAINALSKRVEKTREKLTIAQAEGSDTVDILMQTQTKLAEKLADAQQAYDEYRQNN